MSAADDADAGRVSPCRPEDLPTILEIINESAAAYRGVIPVDRWHEPYMSKEELAAEIRHGVRFHGHRIDGELLGVMGIQEVKEVTLIRHAYVRTRLRGSGIGSALLRQLRRLTQRPVLIGTWTAATWAIRFYERHGFRLADPAEKTRLLKTYWVIPDRQEEESVVLVDEKWPGP